MAIVETLENDVSSLIDSMWSITDGRVVPTAESVTLGNTGIRIHAAVLYADMADSTMMVDTYPDWFAGEMYKAFLVCAAKIIRSEGGSITSYDGDRIMAVFMSDLKADRAIRSAQKIRWAVDSIIKPMIARKYPLSAFELKHVCGIDVSDLLATKTGARNDNDLVWVGRAANHAAKLAAYDDAYSLYVSSDAFGEATDRVKLVGGAGLPVFEEITKPGTIFEKVYRSTSFWTLHKPNP